MTALFRPNTAWSLAFLIMALGVGEEFHTQLLQQVHLDGKHLLIPFLGLEYARQEDSGVQQHI
jgi:hypothetical protein